MNATKKKKAYLNMFLSSGSDYSIRDSDGNRYTSAEAKAVWDSGLVGDFNQAFRRLAGMNFSVQAVKDYYAAGTH